MSCIFYGKRRSGKSHLIRFLLSQVGKQFCYVWVFSKTAFNGFFQSFINSPDFYVTQGFDQGKLRLILDRASMAIPCASCHRKRATHLIIMDDIINDKFWYSSVVRDLFTFGRHYGVAVWLTTQHPTAIHPAARDNADMVFIFRMHNRKFLKMLSDEYVSQYAVRGAMRTLWKVTATAPNQVAVINLQSKAVVKLQDYLAVFKAPSYPPRKFRVGCKDAVQLAKSDTKNKRLRPYLGTTVSNILSEPFKE